MEVYMAVFCPNCGSSHIKERNRAKKVLSAVGGIAGASAGIRNVWFYGKTGMRIGLIAGPAGGTAGTIIGSVLGALVSGSVGCGLGSVVGKKIDNNILNNYKCLDCKCTFSKTDEHAEVDALESYQYQ